MTNHWRERARPDDRACGRNDQRHHHRHRWACGYVELRAGSFVAIDTCGNVVGGFATLWEASRVLESPEPAQGLKERRSPPRSASAHAKHTHLGGVQ
jgi:hypothetical protein